MKKITHSNKHNDVHLYTDLNVHTLKKQTNKQTNKKQTFTHTHKHTHQITGREKKAKK